MTNKKKAKPPAAIVPHRPERATIALQGQSLDQAFRLADALKLRIAGSNISLAWTVRFCVNYVHNIERDGKLFSPVPAKVAQS